MSPAMHITPANQTLAAKLGLFLIREPTTAADHVDAQHPGAVRVPETWLARSMLTRRPLGRLRLTEVDCLYVSKYATGLSQLEETVAEALRWITPLTRHVRTGQYDGTEMIIRRFASMHERPRALTVCGARSTEADYSPSVVQSALINELTQEMCPACRERLEGQGPKGPPRSINSTPRQQRYLRHLLDEGACGGRPCLTGDQIIPQLSLRAASEMIDRLRALRARNWKGDL